MQNGVRTLITSSTSELRYILQTHSHNGMVRSHTLKSRLWWCWITYQVNTREAKYSPKDQEVDPHETFTHACPLKRVDHMCTFTSCNVFSEAYSLGRGVKKEILPNPSSCWEIAVPSHCKTRRVFSYRSSLLMTHMAHTGAQWTNLSLFTHAGYMFTMI